LPGAFNDAHREVIAAAAVRHRLPLIGAYAIPRVGGLISYWFDTADLFVQAASSTASSRAPARPTFRYSSRRNTR
jgi:hypothetical protein